MTLGGCPFHFVSKLQKDISLSILEDEYIYLYQDMCNILYLRRLIQEVSTQLNMGLLYPAIMHSTLFEDNNGALSFSKSPSKTQMTRHIDVKYHLSREHVGEGKGVMIQRLESKDERANIFTKELPEETFQYIRNLLAGW